MSDFKEISSFKFPEYLKDQKGYGLKLTRALIEGQKSIKELYQSSLGGGNQSGWYEHRFIFIQLFFNKGYFFKVKGHDGLIDSSIFDLLDININNMIEHPGDSQEKQAVKTSKVVVNSFLKGEEVLERNYSLAKSRELPELSHRGDSAGWMKHYFGVIVMMFEEGISIVKPEENQVYDNQNLNSLTIIENNVITIAERKQKIRQERK